MPPVKTPPPAVLIDAASIAIMLSCTRQHVYRLVRHKMMPKPVKLRGLYRWKRAEIETWLENGCPARRR